MEVRPLCAFTLVEIVASLLIAGICVGATASAVHIITYGGSDLAHRGESHTAAALALHRMRGELAMALTVTELNATAITFTHPDMTGDATDEVIRYVWSETPGDPVTRSVNGAAPTTLLADCEAFALTVDVRDAQEGTQPQVTGEVLVAAHDQYPLGLLYVTSTMPVTNQDYVGEYFTPSYPDAVSCEITRVRLVMKKWGTASGSARIMIQPRAAGTYNPAPTILGEVQVEGADLPSEFQWREFSFSGVTTAVNDGVLVVVRGTNTNSAAVAVHSLSLVSFIDGMALRYTNNGGATWQPTVNLALADMRIYVYGRYTLSTLVGSGTLASGNVESIHLELHTAVGGPGEDVVMNSAVRCLNKPSITGLPINDVPVR